MRVLFLGDLAPSGFGTVTTDLGRRLVDAGLDVRFMSQNDTGADLPEPFHSRTLSVRSLITLVNMMTDQMANEGAAEVIPSLLDGTSKATLLNGKPWAGWVPEAAILLGDFTAARHMVARGPRFGDIPTYHYVPIEGVDLPPLLKEDLWRVARPVAMSRFGQAEIAKVVGYQPPLIYHGVDTAAFHPVATENSKRGRPIILETKDAKPLKLTSREDCKDTWSQFFQTQLPAIQAADGKRRHSGKWMLRTDRHMPRKRYNSMFRALVPVLHAHPDAILICHCTIVDQGGNLSDSVAKLPGARRLRSNPLMTEPWSLFDRPYAQVILTGLSGIPREALCSLYNAADLYLSTSAEGFGLTVAEALACGVPAVGLDYSAVPEVIGPAGRVVPAAGLVDNEYDHFWAAVDEQAFGRTVHELLANPGLREQLAWRGPRHIRDNFSWDAAAAAFTDLLRGNIWPPKSALPLSATISPSPAPLVSGAPA